MSGGGDLQKLLTWLSPAFPVGAFAWSAGLETEIAGRRVSDSQSLRNWLEGLLAHGGFRTDAIILAQAHRAEGDSEQLARLSELGRALAGAKERHDEMLTTGDAFSIAAKAWPSGVFARLPQPCPYPVAVGAVAGAHGIALGDTLLAYLTTAVHGQVSVAVRLVPLGQSAGLEVMAALEPLVATLAADAATASLDSIGGIAYAAEIAQMRHETLEPRLFRS